MNPPPSFYGGLPTDGIAIAWHDPQVSDSVRTSTDVVPILPRALALNLSLLPAGRYALDLTMLIPHRQPARTRRVFTLRQIIRGNVPSFRYAIVTNTQNFTSGARDYGTRSCFMATATRPAK